MGLSLAQQSLFTKARKLSAGGQGVGLEDAACRAVLLVAARDLGVASIRVPERLPGLFEADLASDPADPGGGDPLDLFTRLCQDGPPDADTYFACLAALHKARRKYQRILQTQPVPTMDQVGPRGLLQYSLLPTGQLAAVLLWRKLLFDLDNRAAQETGYLFEPILAAAIGGTPVSPKQSPVKRRERGGGRQVDAIKGQRAYEFKLRMTIAASGQGRWGEELRFPGDAQASGFTPVLIVLDPTGSNKLTELRAAFGAAGGEAHVGDDAWGHLEDTAGVTMGRFLEAYVRTPLADLLAQGELERELPELRTTLTRDRLTFTIAGSSWSVGRQAVDPELASGQDETPEDATDLLPGL